MTEACLINRDSALGMTNNYFEQAAIEQARIVVAEVNDQLPWTYCDGTMVAFDGSIIWCRLAGSVAGQCAAD